jgi:hypothetical protein
VIVAFRSAKVARLLWNERQQSNTHFHRISFKIQSKMQHPTYDPCQVTITTIALTPELASHCVMQHRRKKTTHIRGVAFFVENFFSKHNTIAWTASNLLF